jgi:3-oxoacyl-[acyl-carrier protein] reductase
VLCARDVAALEDGVKEIKAAGGTATSIALDLRLPESPAELADFAAKRFDGIDIVVNNAGATKRGVFLELTDDDWADGFALKFFGAVRLTRAAWPHLKFSRGSVINISGGGGRTPGAEFAIGGSVNAAMQSFTKAMAELGIADGVQVNVINPGLIRTGRFQKRLEAVAAEQGVDLATAERQMVAASKTTRVGEPEDIAALVAFIAGREGRFLQGAMIDMDGGSTKTL